MCNESILVTNIEYNESIFVSSAAYYNRGSNVYAENMFQVVAAQSMLAFFSTCM